MTTGQAPATCRWCEEPMDGRPCITQTAVVEGVAYHRLCHTRGQPLARRISPGRDVKKLCEGIYVKQTLLTAVCYTLRAWATERGTG